MFSLRERLREILLRDNLISQADLQRAVDEQQRTGGEFSKILMQLNLIGEEDLMRVLSEGLGVPPININRLKPDPEVIKLVPRDIAEKYQILPVSRIGNNLTLAMADPQNIFAIDNIKTVTGLNITPVIASAAQIQQAIEKYYTSDSNPGETLEGIIKDMRDAEELELVKDMGSDADKMTIEDLTQAAPMIKLTDTIVQQAVLARASDVFIEPMEETLRIRYRVDGVIREIDRMPKAFHLPIVSRIKVVSNLDISEHRLPQDGRFKTVASGNKEVDFRVSVLPTAFGEKIVLRVLDKNAGIIDVEKLGFEKESLKRLKESAMRPHGMILSCGPTGSGKTTTLYSILKFADSPGKNIVTVEDPVEYQVKGINQVNVQPAVGLTFSASLRSILRQDPDIILIGEIRDTETLDIAVKAALTGHLVLSSLHTTTAAGSTVRMMNMGIEPFLLCSSVIAIIGQRLLRRVCSHCREEYLIPQELFDRLDLSRLVKEKQIRMYRAKGCKQCFNTGYSGRVGISEVLILTPSVKEAILHRKGELRIKEAGRREGMITMREDGLRKAVEGLTTLEEVLRVTAPDEELKN